MKFFARGRVGAALCVAFCLLVSQAAGAPAGAAGERSRRLGELTSSGPVLVDGQESASGTTVFSGSRLTTAPESVAELNLGGGGRVRLAPRTESLINFDEQTLGGTLDAGAITVSKPAGVLTVFVTKDGTVTAGEAAAVFSLDLTDGGTVVRAESGRVELRAGNVTRTVGPGETASAGQSGGTGNGGSDRDRPGMGRGLAFGIIGFTGVVLAAAIYAITHDNDSQTKPGDVIVISPSR